MKKISEKLAIDEYYWRFKKYNEREFSEIVENIITTWTIKNQTFPKFPSPGDFYVARNNTRKHNEYQASKKLNPEEREEFCGFLLSLAKKYPPEKEIKEKFIGSGADAFLFGVVIAS